MEYISESTDVRNNSDRDVPRFDNTQNASEQSKLETGSITDDCNIYLMVCSISHFLSSVVKRVQTSQVLQDWNPLNYQIQ